MNFNKFWTYKFKQLVLFSFIISAINFYMVGTDGAIGNCMALLWFSTFATFIYIYSTTEGEL
jgi:uncharacterized MAPEG superfamily protein